MCLPKTNQSTLAIVLSVVSLLASGWTVFLILNLHSHPGQNIRPTDESLDETRHFKRPVGTEDLRCDWVMDGEHAEYVKRLAKQRFKFKDPNTLHDLPVDCASIRARHRFPTSATTSEEAEFPIAEARNVYKDYYYIELMLAANYQPQNYYCYAIDKSSDLLFRARVKNLAKCFPNVMVSSQLRDMDSSGRNADAAHIDCLNMLAMAERKWKYVILLQNHDFPAKTNFEKVTILKWLNGSNDIELDKVPRGLQKNDWNLKSMNIFRDPNKLAGIMTTLNSTVPPKMSFAKGYNEISMTREAVDYILKELDLTTFVDVVGKGHWRYWHLTADEIVFPTVLSMETLGIPGHTTQKCMGKKSARGYITRHSNWRYRKGCGSKNFRHGICIYGIEDLGPHVDPLNELYVNKIMGDFDFNAVVCWSEVLYNRTFILEPTLQRLNQSFYRNLNHVRYQALKDENGRVSKRKQKEFNCK